MTKTNITITDQTENEPLRGRDLYIDRLVNRDGPRNTAPAEAEPLGVDGNRLSGYERYKWNLCHPKTAAKGAR
jgi:hypothetical protein